MIVRIAIETFDGLIKCQIEVYILVHYYKITSPIGLFNYLAVNICVNNTHLTCHFEYFGELFPIDYWT